MKKIGFAFAILLFCVKVFSSSVNQFDHLRNPFHYHSQVNKHVKLAQQNISALKYVGFMQVNQENFALLQATTSLYAWMRRGDVLGLQKAKLKAFDQQKMVLTMQNKQRKQFFIIKRWVDKS